MKTNNPESRMHDRKPEAQPMMGGERRHHLFHPDSIAVVGASERPGSVGQAVMPNLIDGGFAGTICPVNNKHASMMGCNAVNYRGVRPNWCCRCRYHLCRW